MILNYSAFDKLVWRVLYCAFYCVLCVSLTGTSIMMPSIAVLIRQSEFIATVKVERIDVYRSDRSVETDPDAQIGPISGLSPQYTCRVVNGGVLKGSLENSNGLVTVEYGEDDINTVRSLNEGVVGLELVLFKKTESSKQGWLLFGVEEETEFQIRVLESSERQRPKELCGVWTLSGQRKKIVDVLPGRMELLDSGQMLWSSMSGESSASGVWCVFEDHLVVELKEELVPLHYWFRLKDSIQAWRIRRSEDEMVLTTRDTAKDFVFQRL